jgi:chromosome segregation ATPase
LTSLTAIFGSSNEKPDEQEPDSEKLLNLYWNRADLKKEFAELRSEKYRLQGRVKEHEGATARVQQKLDHLEKLLLDPEWVYNIVTFFQLRALNNRCQSKLAKFAEQLKQQREERLQSKVLDEWNERRAEEAAGIEREVGEQRLQVQSLEDRLQTERHSLATMSGFMRLLRGKQVTLGLDMLAANIDAAQNNERSLLLKLDEIEKRSPPGTRGLDTATKRVINFMILSFAQQLYLHFKEDDLAELAKESGEMSIGAINYGGKASCDEIITRMRKRLDKLDNATDFAELLQRRAKLIADKAVFRGDDDAVPVGVSVSTIFSFDKNGDVKEDEQNLLGENYWNLTNVVSR